MSNNQFIGKTFGSYKLLEPLGEGGMGAVYRGYQESIDRYVAVKLLPARLLHDPGFLTRFNAEARALAKLNHPAILPLYEYGEANDMPYIVMPIMAGGSFAERLKDGPMPLQDMLRYLTPIAEALNFAHQQGILHRDVKPRNIMLDDRDSPFLADFGLAQLMKRGQVAGEISGTPAYMSPEQAQGEALDARSDVYSLGVVVFEALVGCLPFESEQVSELLAKHISEPPPRPKTLRPDISAAVEEIILKVLAKNPADRYQTTTEFFQALSNAAFLSRDFWRPISRPSARITPAVVEASPPPAAPDTQKFSAAYRATLPPAVEGDALTRQAASIGEADLPDAPEGGALPMRPAERISRPGKAAPQLFVARLVRFLRETRLPAQIRIFLLAAPGVLLLTIISAGVWIFFIDPYSARPILSPQLAAWAPGLFPSPTETPTPTSPPTQIPSATPTLAPTTPPEATATPAPTLTPTPTPLIIALRHEDQMPMVLIPAGTFAMGAASEDTQADFDERPQHRVTLDNFYIDRYEVSVAQYVAFLKTLKKHIAACLGFTCIRTKSELLNSHILWDNGAAYAAERGYESYPVDNVTWFGAEAYCKWVAARLPTEAEWEYAARSDDARLYPWGNAAPDAMRAVFGSTSYADLQPVDALSGGASPFGVYGLSGGVWEWAADRYQADYYTAAPVENPAGPEGVVRADRVQRGGSWKSSSLALRVSSRSGADPLNFAQIGEDGGFRCARD